MAKSMVSRFKGATVGAVVGDCLGAEFEMKWQLDVKKVVDFFVSFSKCSESSHPHGAEHDNESHEDNELEVPIKQKKRKQKNTRSGPLHPFTDDTAMARSVAYSLISKSSAEPVDLAKRFVYEFNKEPGRGYGASVGTVFSKLAEEDYYKPFGPASEQFDGSGSYGNGGAMRIVPAALYGYNIDSSKLSEVVNNITRITHSHPDAINGAHLQCSAVHQALHLQEGKALDANAFIDQLLEVMVKLEQEPDKNADNLNPPSPKRKAKRVIEESEQPYCEKLRLIKEYLALETDVERSELEDTLGNDVSALGSVPAAIYSFLRSTKPIVDVPFDTPFERAIVYAVTLGGDTDTIATMAGAMAGAFYGLEAIPKHWTDVCEGVHDAMNYGEQLYELSMKSAQNDNAHSQSSNEKEQIIEDGDKQNDGKSNDENISG